MLVMLTNKALLQKHGHHLWSLVPARWRHWWWLPSVEVIQELSGVMIDDPKPVVKDVTVEQELIQDSFRQNKLAELKYLSTIISIR
jgi:hypothetical protein